MNNIQQNKQILVGVIFGMVYYYYITIVSPSINYLLNAGCVGVSNETLSFTDPQ